MCNATSATLWFPVEKKPMTFEMIQHMGNFLPHFKFSALLKCMICNYKDLLWSSVTQFFWSLLCKIQYAKATSDKHQDYILAENQPLALFLNAVQEFEVLFVKGKLHRPVV